jgi:hypothetical protein
MKITLTGLIFLFSISSVFAQFNSCCIDSTRVPDPYFQCLTPQYEPVCGCDLVTYRNACAAEMWGGLINNGFCLGWTENTICGNFDFDFIPSAVTYFPVQFSLYMKEAGSATLYIYDRMGKLMVTEYFNSYWPSPPAIQRELNLQNLEVGIYFMVVVVNGEKLSKRIAKVLDSLE